jgi:hypothetical protein
VYPSVELIFDSFETCGFHHGLWGNTGKAIDWICSVKND